MLSYFYGSLAFICMILAPGAVEGELYITAVVLIVFFALFAKLSVLEEKRMRRRKRRVKHGRRVSSDDFRRVG